MKTTIVTGASSGIGHATAELLAARGHHVIGMARRTDLMPANIVRVGVDLAEPSAATRALEGAGREAHIDGLVHCAGYGDFAPLELTSAAQAQRQLQVNLLSAAELVQAVLPGMRQRGAGRIVLVSSIASRFSSPMGGWYHASKAALEAYADSLRQEVHGFGIDVCVVQPGVVRTAWHDTAMDGLLAVTRDTAYERAGSATAAYHARSADSAMACEPMEVVGAILQALDAPHPPTRHLVGRGSRIATLLPRLVSDRTFDRLTLRQFGISPARA